jgi:Uma2 family endonuclease
MTSIAERLLTADEFQMLPDDPEGRKMELFDGRVVYMAHPGEEHSDCASSVVIPLSAFVADHRLGKVRFDVGYKIRVDPDRVVSPDASFVSHDRLAPGRDRTKFFQTAPNLAVEVVSPNDLERDVSEKVEEYLEAGSERVWVIRPIPRTVTVHRPGGRADTYSGDDVLTSDEAGLAVEGFTLRVAAIFES